MDLVRAELAKRDEYLVFAQTQMEKDRSRLTALLVFIVTIVGIVATTAIYFTGNSIKEFRNDMTQAGKDEIANVHARVEKGVTTQVEDFKKDIARRFSDEFADEKIQQRITGELGKMTDQQLKGLIQDISGAQVKNEASKLKPELRQMIKDDSNAVLAELKPTIKDTVGIAINNQIEESVAPVRGSVEELNATVKVQRAIANLWSNVVNRSAFDYLERVATGKEPESRFDSLRKVSQQTIVDWSAALAADGLGPDYSGNDIPTLRKIIAQPGNINNTVKKMVAIDNYPLEDKTVLPLLVEVVRNDPGFGVVLAAIRRINKISNNNFDYLRREDLFNWWESQKKNHP
ncbi:hypothetical protein SAMN05216517_101190 [Janthinobacterium sp. OK676]|jgi:hypothetical protein|uniref:hypothetical protein n=1 Tax=Janthinobacterium sp. OK676 TaxID=1855295 RepID=UPI000888F431|nr:hypothetical protein [Janthinobacterium sp. OK676]SDL45109.1 hypothetical protein SAMN05216517_101190 [Janthinobacterium sp. OK676]